MLVSLSTLTTLVLMSGRVAHLVMSSRQATLRRLNSVKISSLSLSVSFALLSSAVAVFSEAVRSVLSFSSLLERLRSLVRSAVSLLFSVVELVRTGGQRLHLLAERIQRGGLCEVDVLVLLTRDILFAVVGVPAFGLVNRRIEAELDGVGLGPRLTDLVAHLLDLVGQLGVLLRPRLLVLGVQVRLLDEFVPVVPRACRTGRWTWTRR